MVLADIIDWGAIERLVPVLATPGPGRPAIRTRLIAGLLYLEYAFKLSDSEVVTLWLENPHWQIFTGETYLQTDPPIDPSGLSRWRRSLGEAGVEEMLAQSIEAARRSGVIKAWSASRVIGTTVRPKAIAFPTDSAPLERSRARLVKIAQQHGLGVRQNYNRVAPRPVRQIGRYAHAKHFKRKHATIRLLRTWVGRVHRDAGRQRDRVPADQRGQFDELMGCTRRILRQKRRYKNKLYAFHAPEVECIAKGKSRTPYEFGVNVSIVTTWREDLVLGSRSMPGNPFDGHTLGEALEQAEILSEVKPTGGRQSSCPVVSPHKKMLLFKWLSHPFPFEAMLAPRRQTLLSPKGRISGPKIIVSSGTKQKLSPSTALQKNK